MHTIGKATTAVLAAVFAIAMTTFSSLAASDFEGVWKEKDTAGQPFEITLSGGGAAKASRGEGMVGRSTGQQYGRAKGKVTALRLLHSRDATVISPLRL